MAYHLDINDFTFGTHRSHGEIIAKGLSAIEKLDDKDTYEIMKNFLGGKTLAAVEGKEENKGCIKDLAFDFLLYGALAEMFARKRLPEGSRRLDACLFPAVRYISEQCNSRRRRSCRYRRCSL